MELNGDSRDTPDRHALQVLKCSAILQGICLHLSPNDDLQADPEQVTKSRRDLVWAALSCRRFLEPALNKLWRSLDTLYPLLKLLSAFQLVDTVYVLRGRATAEEWDRFDWYARRVKRFCYSANPTNLSIAMHVYFRLAQLRSTPILPCLEHLSCPNFSQRDFMKSGVCIFLSPSIEHVEFHKITAVEDLLYGTVLHTLWDLGAQLRAIGVRGSGMSAGTMDLILNFESLRELELTGFGAVLHLERIKQLGVMPKLTELALDFMGSPMEAPEEDLGFAGLTSLITTGPLSFIRAFLSHVATPILRDVVTISIEDNQNEREQYMREVAERWGATLNDISLTRVFGGEDEPEDVDITTIAPLIPLKQLTCLHLDGYIFNLTNDGFKTLGRAWPKLKKLLLPFHGSTRARASVEALEILEALCPELEHIRIALDIPNIPPYRLGFAAQSRDLEQGTLVPSPDEHLLKTPGSTSPTSKPGIGNTGVISMRSKKPHKLQTLTIATSDDVWDHTSQLNLSHHIDRLFPYIRKVDSFEGISEERWSQVQDIVRAFQLVRAEAKLMDS